MDYREDLKLSNMVDLEREVSDLIPSLVRCLEDNKDKSSITITLGFQLCEDSDSHLTVTTKVKPTFPSKNKKILAARNLIGNLTADAFDLGKKPTTKQISLIDAMPND